MSHSRSSTVSPTPRYAMPQMPVIAEDGNVTEPTPERRSAVPRALRVPRRTYRRSDRSRRPIMPFIAEPHPLSEKYQAGAGSASVTHSSSGSTTHGDSDGTDELLRKQHDLERVPSHNTHRRRWLRLLVIVGILALAIMALAIGLGVGLANRNSSSDSADSNRTSDKVLYPAGSFTFNTELQTVNTSCTSNPSTWRCYPYRQGGAAKFFWIISEPQDEDSDYTVSSSDNPFAPSFRNLSMSRLDPDSSNERFVFSFNTTRTVVPSESIGADNRATKCLFKDTKFEATIWTRRRDDREISMGDKVDSKFGDWPGDIEVRQIKESQPNQPTCEDDGGAAIADVQAGQGNCECGYSNF